MKDILLNVKVSNTKKHQKINIRPSLNISTYVNDNTSGSLSEKDRDLGEALYLTKEIGIPATDWEIENRAKALGFKSTLHLLEESMKILKKRIKKDFKGDYYYKVSHLFRRRR